MGFKKESITIEFFIISFILLLSFSYAQSLPGDWKGYVTINSSTAIDGTPVQAYVAGSAAESTTVGAVESGTGYYLIHVTGTSGQNVTFKVCGVTAYPTNVTPEIWSVGPHTSGSSPYFNLSITTQSNGNSCTYACGCSGGYCNSGSCASSPPSGETTTTISGGGGGGGGGGGNVTTTTGTTIGTTTAGTTTSGTTSVGTTTSGTTAPTTAKICETEGNRCGKGYLSCCSGLTCRGNKCAKPVKGLEIAPTTGIVIGAAVVIIIVIISVIYFTVIKGRMIIK